MNKQRVADVISLCKRAGGLVVGFDMLKQAIVMGDSDIIISAHDLSDKTKKEINYISNKHSIRNIEVPISLDEFWYLIGKRTGVMTITNEGLKGKFLEVIADDEKNQTE